MRKHQTLLIAGILLLVSPAVAQAQEIYEAYGIKRVARTGGAAELAGGVVLFLRSGGTFAGGTVTVTYSAPLAKGTAPMVMRGATDLTIGSMVMMAAEDGVVMFNLPAGLTTAVTLQNVRLDLREAEAPVTAEVSGDADAIVSGVVEVVSSIQDALMVTSTMTPILTRGGMDSATVTLEETFAGAFTSGADVKLTLVGVPNKAKLKVHGGYVAVAVADSEDAAAQPAGVAGTVTLDTVTIAMDGNLTDATVANVRELEGDGGKLDIIVGFGNEAGDVDEDPSATGSKEKLTLTFELDTTTSDMLPLAEGAVEVWVTMAPNVAPPAGDLSGGTEDEYFAVNYLPADGVVAFTIAPASCTLLFPYVANIPAEDWDTGIAISNPSAFNPDTAVSGTITFTLFPNDEEMIVHSTDGMSSGTGLAEDGSLPAGNTHTVLLSEVLDDAGMPGDFIGHLYVRTNFTGCRGVGWITNWTTVNQAYLPYFGDNLDEGDVPANNAAQ